MTSIAGNAVLIAHRSRLVVNGERVIYRGDGRGGEVDMIKARGDQEAIADEAGGVSFKLVDWIVAAEDLFIDGEPITPAAGHEIDWVDAGGRKHTYRLANREDLRCFQPSDADEQLLRLYAVEILTSAEGDDG